MATRGDIRDAFYNELSTLAGTYSVTDASGTQIRTVDLAADDIGLVDPEAVESLPALVYDDSYVRVEHNGVGSGPDAVIDADGNGVVDKEVWREYVEAQFSVFVRAANDLDKEPIYEKLRTTFQKYRFGPWNETDFHADVRDIEVLDSTSADSGDVDQVIRGDQLSIFIEFYREYDLTDDNIETIDQTADADTDDSTSGISFTTS